MSHFALYRVCQRIYVGASEGTW